MGAAEEKEKNYGSGGGEKTKTEMDLCQTHVGPFSGATKRDNSLRHCLTLLCH